MRLNNRTDFKDAERLARSWEKVLDEVVLTDERTILLKDLPQLDSTKPEVKKRAMFILESIVNEAGWMVEHLMVGNGTPAIRLS